jgi:hypothetical protein
MMVADGAVANQESAFHEHNHHHHTHVCQVIKFHVYEMQEAAKAKCASTPLEDCQEGAATDYMIARQGWESDCSEDAHHHHGGEISEDSLVHSVKQDINGGYKGGASSALDDVGGSVREHTRVRRQSMKKDGDSNNLLVELKADVAKRVRRKAIRSGTPTGDAAGTSAGSHNHHLTADFGFETVVAFGPLWEAGGCFAVGVKNLFMSAASFVHARSNAVCKDECTSDTECEGSSPLVYDYTGATGNGRAVGTKKAQSTCMPTAGFLSRINPVSTPGRRKAQQELSVAQAELDPENAAPVKGTCIRCRGPGSICRYNTDCVSGTCVGNRFGMRDGKCTDSGRLPGASCKRDNECEGSATCRGAYRGYGVCSKKLEDMQACGAETGKEAGCLCSSSSQCASNNCAGSSYNKILGRGACVYAPVDNPVVKSCHEHDEDCAKCAIAKAHDMIGVHGCVYSIGEATDQPEDWQGGDGEAVSTRKKKGCYADKSARTWADNRYIDAAHKDRCGKTAEEVKSRAAKIKDCHTLTTCEACVDQDASGMISSNTYQCVWSPGPAADVWENWGTIGGPTAAGPMKVSRSKKTATGQAGGRCSFKKQSTNSWEANRWIDRPHKAMCAKVDVAGFDVGTAKDTVMEEKDQCEELESCFYGKSKCKKCAALPFCNSKYVPGYVQNCCHCSHKTA